SCPRLECGKPGDRNGKQSTGSGNRSARLRLSPDDEWNHGYRCRPVRPDFFKFFRLEPGYIAANAIGDRRGESVCFCWTRHRAVEPQLITSQSQQGYYPCSLDATRGSISHARAYVIGTTLSLLS